MFVSRAFVEIAIRSTAPLCYKVFKLPVFPPTSNVLKIQKTTVASVFLIPTLPTFFSTEFPCLHPTSLPQRQNLLFFRRTLDLSHGLFQSVSDNQHVIRAPVRRPPVKAVKAEAPDDGRGSAAAPADGPGGGEGGAGPGEASAASSSRVYLEARPSHSVPFPVCSII